MKQKEMPFSQRIGDKFGFIIKSLNLLNQKADQVGRRIFIEKLKKIAYRSRQKKLYSPFLVQKRRTTYELVLRT